jgi:two-component system, OmpR family, alkaline phosphatase synthesis response regulator PhoP
MDTAARPRVLVVDDDSALREGLVAVLDSKGYDVLSATQGEEALERAYEFHPKVVLLDIVMPVMDGLSFLAERNRRPSLAKIPVVAMTGRGDGGSALERNADALVSKPFEPEEIVRLVEHYIRRS